MNLARMPFLFLTSCTNVLCTLEAETMCDIPTSVVATRVPHQRIHPIVVISDGVEIWVALGCSKGSFFYCYFNTRSGIRATNH